MFVWKVVLNNNMRAFYVLGGMGFWSLIVSVIFTLPSCCLQLVFTLAKHPNRITLIKQRLILYTVNHIETHAFANTATVKTITERLKCEQQQQNNN